MPTWRIEQYELHCQGYEIEAPTAAEAIRQLLDGEAEADDNGSEYLEVEEERGMPIEEDPALAKALRGLGVSLGEVFIPSIRRVFRIDETDE